MTTRFGAPLADRDLAALLDLAVAVAPVPVVDVSIVASLAVVDLRVAADRTAVEVVDPEDRCGRDGALDDGWLVGRAIGEEVVAARRQKLAAGQKVHALPHHQLRVSSVGR